MLTHWSSVFFCTNTSICCCVTGGSLSTLTYVESAFSHIWTNLSPLVYEYIYIYMYIYIHIGFKALKIMHWRSAKRWSRHTSVFSPFPTISTKSSVARYAYLASLRLVHVRRPANNGHWAPNPLCWRKVVIDTKASYTKIFASVTRNAYPE